MALQVPFKLQNPFTLFKKGKSKSELVPPSLIDGFSNMKRVDSVSFRPVISQKRSLKAVGQTQGRIKARIRSDGICFRVCSSSQTQCWSLHSANSKSNSKYPRMKGNMWLHAAPEKDVDSVLSLHTPMDNLKHIERLCIDIAPLDPNRPGDLQSKSKYLHFQLNQMEEKER